MPCIFEVAIESWPEWDLNPRPLNSVSDRVPNNFSNQQVFDKSKGEYEKNFKRKWLQLNCKLN